MTVAELATKLPGAIDDLEASETVITLVGMGVLLAHEFDVVSVSEEFRYFLMLLVAGVVGADAVIKSLRSNDDGD